MRKFLQLFLGLAVLSVAVSPAFAQAGFGAAYKPNCGCQPKKPSEISVTIQDDENDVKIGTQITIQAIVEPTQGGPSPTGEVDFYYGTYLFASSDVHNNEADVVLDTRHVPPGVIKITAHYLGDDTYTGSYSNVASFTLIGVPNSETSLAVSPSSVSSGGSITMTADVQPRSGGPAATGYVLFFVAGSNTYLGGSPVENTVGTLTKSTSGVPVGKYGVYAVYLGDNNYVSSSSGVETVQVTK